MAYAQNYTLDPTQQRLNELFLQLCSDTGTSGKDQLVINNGCFQVIDPKGNVINQLCLTGFGFPTDSVSLVTYDLINGESIELFNNHLEDYYGGPLPTNKTFVRGIMLLVKYPNLDANGITIDPARYNVKLGIQNLSIRSVGPNVNAGFAINAPSTQTSVTLTGIAAPNAGSIISKYKWSKVSSPVGDASAILSPNTISTKVNTLIPGTYVFKLDVTDSESRVASATVTVRIAALGATPPTVSAGTSSTATLTAASGSGINLAGTATPNGGASSITSTVWAQVGGPGTVTITSPGSLSTTVTGFTQPGVYTFELTATDNLNFVATSSVMVTVYDMKEQDVPLHNLFTHFSNPVTIDPTMLLNSITVTPLSSTMPVCVTALLINTRVDDPTSTASNSNCNC